MKLLNEAKDLLFHNGEESREIEIDSPIVAVRHVQNHDAHRLRSTAGESRSSVISIARYHEERRSNRIKVVFKVQRCFLQRCREIAKSHAESDGGYHISRITVGQLRDFREEVQEKINKQDTTTCLLPFRKLCSYIGFPLESQILLKVLDHAMIICAENYKLSNDDWFYYQDFCFYNTKQQSRWPFLRNKMYQSFCILILYWVLTPVFFCYISFDAGVCKVDPTDPDESAVEAWKHAMFFASVSMALVGYNDASVENGTVRYKTFFGVVYIGIAISVALFAFAAAAESAFSPFKRYYALAVDRIVGKPNKEELLHRRMRRFRLIVYADVLVEFLALNLLGVFVSRYYANTTDIPEEQWDWIQSFYWTVMTTTKMGYGDIAMTYRLHWFQILFLVLGTYFIGDAIGKLASLREDERMVRRKYAWERRQITHTMLTTMQCNRYDDKVDQYEFMMASLISLGKISSEDVIPIMNKFRELANGSGAITLKDIEDHGHVEDELDDPQLVDDL